jgi:hypothetical protein
MFVLEVCNSSHSPVWVAYAGYKDATDSNMTLRAWWEVGSSKCEMIAVLPFTGDVTPFDLFVKQGDNTLVRTDVFHCIANKVIDREVRDPYPCPQGEDILGFQNFSIARNDPDGKFTFYVRR